MYGEVSLGWEEKMKIIKTSAEVPILKLSGGLSSGGHSEGHYIAPLLEGVVEGDVANKGVKTFN